MPKATSSRVHRKEGETSPPFTVEVSTHLALTPEQAFPYFTDPERHVQWMGTEATLDPVPLGTYWVRMPDGFGVAGTYLSVDPPHQVAFTWGFADADAAGHVKGEAPEGNPMPAGSTRVTVLLSAEQKGTRLTLRHENLPTAELRDGNKLGWETYLDRLAVRTSGGDPPPDPHS